MGAHTSSEKLNLQRRGSIEAHTFNVMCGCHVAQSITCAGWTMVGKEQSKERATLIIAHALLQGLHWLILCIHHLACAQLRFIARAALLSH